MTHNILKHHDDDIREIDMPDGSKRAVCMTPELWNSLEFIEIFENIKQAEVAAFAVEEMDLQGVSFDRAFRGVVAYIANQWT